MAKELFYDGDEDYAVDLFDEVEATVEGDVFIGRITRIHLKAAEVTVRYEDHRRTFRTTGRSPKKSCRLSIRAVSLIARDG